MNKGKSAERRRRKAAGLSRDVAVTVAGLPRRLGFLLSKNGFTEEERWYIRLRRGLSSGYCFPACTEDFLSMEQSFGATFRPRAGDGDKLVWPSIIDGNSEIILFDRQKNKKVRMTNHPATQTNPDISESYVVWQDDRNSVEGPIRNYDIYLYDLVAKKGKKLSQAPGNHEEPKIDGNYVVWHNTSRGESNVVVYNLSTNKEETITDNTNAFGIQLDGQIVTWMQYNSPYFDIYTYNLSTKQQVRLTYGEGDHKDPYISGDTIVWHDYRNADRDIYAYNLSATKEQAVAKGPGVDRILGFANGTLVYENKTDQQLYAYNLDTTAVEKLHYSSSTGNIIVLGEAILSVTASGVSSSNIQSSTESGSPGSGVLGTNPPSGITSKAASSEENKETKQVTVTSTNGTHVEHKWKVTRYSL